MSYRETPAVAVGLRKSDKEPINLTNCKPFRTKGGKIEARKNARRDSDGTYRSTTAVLFHHEHKA